ncbi:MAG: hypothetical protein PVI57_08420 [Gemmatimonadota bacterium]
MQILPGSIGRASLATLAGCLLAATPTFLAGQQHPSGGAVFQTSDRCIACHQGVSTRAGKDVSIGFDWRASMMANSARDPYWQAAVRREITDHPAAREAIENECSRCHMPMANTMAHFGGGTGRVFANVPGASDPGAPDPATVQPTLAADGASCSMCHQIRADGLGTRESFVGGFVVAAPEEAPGAREIFGPFEVDTGRKALMRSAVGFEPGRAEHIQSSELCATCHTLYTHALDEQGRDVGELPEQVPYLEWRHSAHADEGRSCQSCHMPVVREQVPVTGVLGLPRADVSRHVFRGGNFFMLGMLNRHRDEMGIRALPQEMDAAVQRTLDHLAASAARVTVGEPALENGALVAVVEVENLAGHKLPTAYPSRRAWLHVTVRDGTGRAVFESGAVTPEGRIVGNDNDDDPARYEPHHTEITSSGDVQIYEAIMVDSRGDVTTGLIRAVEYRKDSRLTPRGFDKTAAHEDVAVHGAASDDADFGDGRDRVRFAVPVDAGAGPFTVEAELLYQPIGFRWARNLAAYSEPEPRRFVGWFDDMAHASWALLARDRAVLR